MLICPEKSVRNVHYTPRNSPEERISHLLRSGSLKFYRQRSSFWEEFKVTVGFITVFFGSCSESDESTPNTSHFSNIYFVIILPSMPRSSKWYFFFQDFLSSIYTKFPSHQSVQQWRFYLFIPIIFGEYESRISSLCRFLNGTCYFRALMSQYI